MYGETFASHLGFDTWAHLLNASEPVVNTGTSCTWYIVKTETWYKWVVWDTSYDMLYNYTSWQDALIGLQLYLKHHHIQRCQWLDASRVTSGGFGDVG